MSMASYEPDWDAGTEVRYEEARKRYFAGLCEVCRQNAALPDDDVCEACREELLPELEEVEAA